MKTYNLYFAEGVLDAAKKDNNEKVAGYVSRELNKIKKELEIS